MPLTVAYGVVLESHDLSLDDITMHKQYITILPRRYLYVGRACYRQPELTHYSEREYVVESGTLDSSLITKISVSPRTTT